MQNRTLYSIMQPDDGEEDASLKDRLAGRFSGLVKIGEGAFSVVYRASMVEQPAKQVALKCINPTCAPSRIVAEMDHLIALQYVLFCYRLLLMCSN